MDLTLSPEQEAIRDAIRAVLAARSPLARVRAVVTEEPGLDPAVWRAAGELGWFGLATPLAPRGAATEVLAGTCRVAVIDDPEERLGAGASLDGEAPHVPDAAAAQALLVLGARRVRWCAADARGVGIRPVASLDPTRRLARVGFAAAPATVLDADAARVRLEAAVLVAAEAVGVAERTLELSVEYAKVRQQFGRPIGAFQAIKHRCADMAVRTEAARALMLYAAVA